MSTATRIQNRRDPLREVGKQRHFFSGAFLNFGSLPELHPATTLVDRFVLKKLVARSSRAVLYLAEDLLQTVDVALKIVDAGPMSEQCNLSALRSEFSINRRISEFGHILRVFDIYSTEFGGTTLLFLSLEYADGGSLREWLVENEKNPERRLSVGLHYFKQACQGLCHFHDVGIFRLDIKPENMVFVKGGLKLSDTASAIDLGNSEEGKSAGKDRYGIYHCTPQYMSPEQFSSNLAAVSLRSDIYSLGVILYELLHPKCRLPFDGSPEILRELHLRALPPPLRNVPENLMKVITRCLEKDPNCRYQSVRELLADLDRQTSNDATKSKREPDEIMQRARESFNQGDFNEANGLLEEVLSIETNHKLAMELRRQIKERFEQARISYQMIIEELEQSDLNTLVGHLEHAIVTYRDHPDGIFVQRKLEARVKRYTLALEKATEALKKGLWESALEWLGKAYQLGGGTVQLNNTIEVLSNIKSIRREMHQALVHSEFDEARRLARFADAVIRDMAEAIPILRRGYANEGDNAL